MKVCLLHGSPEPCVTCRRAKSIDIIIISVGVAAAAGAGVCLSLIVLGLLRLAGIVQ